VICVEVTKKEIHKKLRGFAPMGMLEYWNDGIYRPGFGPVK
jgi:hypothetical protein